MDSLIRQALFVSGVTVIAAVVTLGSVAQAGEFKRFP
jgi:hypothetical protein